jgi:RNA polymerase sigma factor (sigma-70 family)
MTEMGKPTVYIIDDDNDVRDALSLVLSLRGYATAVFGSAEDFLAAYRPEWRGCLLLDIKLGGTSGLDLQGTLLAQNSQLPIVIITGNGDVASARAALKAGATDYLEKPIDDEQLLDVVSTALEREARREMAKVTEADSDKRLSRLTRRERQVMDLVVVGRHNKEIADALGISPRTVEVYRTRVMEKLQVRNLAELIRFTLGADQDPGS